jgi:hypothetical protein
MSYEGFETLPGQTRLNPVKPGQKPGLVNLLTGSGLGSEAKHQTPKPSSREIPMFHFQNGKKLQLQSRLSSFIVSSSSSVSTIEALCAPHWTCPAIPVRI